MKDENHSLLICPICKEELVLTPLEKTYLCKNNHNFDVARQGYVNLLTSNHKNSKLPGDSKEMVQARRDFLNKGYYQTLSSKINECIIEYLEANHSSFYHILDIGCGEGYYTSQLMRATQEKNIFASFLGLDISKEAVKYASSSNKSITWLVANSHDLPLQENSFHCILSVFSPVKIEECTRIMKDKAIFIRILPGRNHLIQMRNIIYDKVVINEGEDPIDAYEGLTYIKTSKVCFDICLPKKELLSLVKMTPHYWKTSKAKKEPLNHLDSLIVTVDMQIHIYEKC